MVLNDVSVLSKFSVPFRFSVYFIPKFLYSIKIAELGRMRWARHVERMMQGLGVYRNSLGKLRGKKSLGKPRRRRESIIKTGLEAAGWTGVWNGLNWLSIGTSCLSL